jgi:DNA polymerase
MNLSKWMIVGQNPGVRECTQGEPFVGPAGKNFDDEIAKHGLSRNHFYITNVVKCHTKDNDAKLVDAAIPRCSPFVTMEINILRPKLIITLGAYSFRFLSDEPYSASLGNIVRSDDLELDIFPIYHPSPLNLRVKERRIAYEQQIAHLCALIKVVDKIT